MLLPFLIFWIIIILGRRQLGWRGIGITIAIWVGLLVACSFSGSPAYLFVAAQAILDAVLVIVVCGDDIRIN
ncbi:MAG: hypothetical protein WC869_11170 [Phycisphaerae bacterium]|jgi:hypothetical protein